MALDQPHLILETYQQKGHGFDGVNLVTALNRLAKLTKRKKFSSYRETLVEDVAFRGLVNDIKNYGVQNMTHRELPCVVWALSSLRAELDPDLFKDVAIQSTHIVDTFPNVGLCNLVLSYARTANTPGLEDPHIDALFACVAQEARSRLESDAGCFNGQDFAVMCYAFAVRSMSKGGVKVRSHAEELFKQMAQVLVKPEILGQLSSQAIALLLWSYARVGFTNHALYSKLGSAIMRQWDTRNPGIPQIVSAAWALATMSNGTKFYRKFNGNLVTIVDPVLHELSLSEMSGVAWALSFIRHPAPRSRNLFARISRLLELRIQESSPRILAVMAGAFAAVDVVVPETFEAIEVEAIKQMDDFKTIDLAMIAKAFTEANMPADRLFEAVEVKARKHKSEFDARELCNLLKGFAIMRGTDNNCFVGEIAAEVKNRQNDFSEEEMLHLATAFLEAGVHIGIFPKYRHQQEAWVNQSAIPTTQAPWTAFPMIPAPERHAVELLSGWSR